MSTYGDWIGRSIVAPRAPADRAALTRAMKIVVGSMQRLPNEQMKRLMGAKLAVLPFLESLLADDASMRSALNVPFEAVRHLAADVVVPSDRYVAAVVAAMTGSPAGITDRKGRRYHVRPASLLIADGLPTVVYAREDGLVTFAGTWRERVLIADIDELGAIFAGQHCPFELTTSEAEHLALEFGDLPAPQRLHRLDQLMRGLPSAFYDHLFQRLADGIEVAPHQLLPEDAAILVSFCMADERSAEARATSLLERNSWVTVFERLSGLPIRMPDAIVERFRMSAQTEQRLLLRRWLRRARTPVSVMHVVRFVAVYSSGPVFCRFLARIVVLALQARSAVQEYLRCVRWFANEFSRREECRHWPAATLILVTWVHADQVLSRISRLGYGFGTINSVLPLSAAREAEFFSDNTTFDTPAHPNRVRPEQLLVCGLADALGDRPDSINDVVADRLEAALRTASVHLPWHANLYFGVETRTDPVSSYLNGRRCDQLRALLGGRFTESDVETFSQEFLRCVLRDKLATDDEWWLFVAARIQGDCEPEQSALAYVTALSAVDGVAEGLRVRSQATWCMRLNTVTRSAAIIGGDALLQSRTLWCESVRLLRERGGGDVRDAATLLQSVADHARSAGDRNARLQQITDDLEQLVEVPGILAEYARQIAARLRDRLPAIEVEVKLSRVILLARSNV